MRAIASDVTRSVALYSDTHMSAQNGFDGGAKPFHRRVAAVDSSAGGEPGGSRSMGLVYVYLVAWIAGGVLLGANMLLDQSGEQAIADEAPAQARSPARAAAQLAALGLIGFGLGGLAAEGLGLLNSPWTETCALGCAALLGTIGYFTAPQQHRD
jgi:hypothetical protein